MGSGHLGIELRLQNICKNFLGFIKVDWTCKCVIWLKKFKTGQGPKFKKFKNFLKNFRISQFLKFLAYGYAVVIVDGRGSANRGVSFEGHIKEAMGSVEMEDQVEGLKQAIDQTGNILDGERVVCIGKEKLKIIFENFKIGRAIREVRRTHIALGLAKLITLICTAFFSRFRDLKLIIW